MPWLTLSGSNYPCLERISMVPKMFEPLRFDCTWKQRIHKRMKIVVSVWLVGLEFNGPVKPFSLPNHTFPGQAQYSKWLTSTCAHSFTRYWQLPFLSQLKGENDHVLRNICWSISMNEWWWTQCGANPLPPDHQSDTDSSYYDSSVVCRAA